MARYSFLTTWALEAALEPVWDAIYDTCAWPRWWDGVRRADELVPRGPDGVGGVSRFTFRSRLPYDLTFEMRSTRVERHVLMEGLASGELTGVGTWRFARAGDLTVVTYAWEVETAARWMNLARPAGTTGLRVEPRPRDALRGARPRTPAGCTARDGGLSGAARPPRSAGRSPAGAGTLARCACS